MPELPHLSGREIIRVLEQLGFIQVRQPGSHVIMKKSTSQGDVGCVVPLHEEIAIGTLRSILKQAKVSPEEFVNIYKYRK